VQCPRCSAVWRRSNRPILGARARHATVRWPILFAVTWFPPPPHSSSFRVSRRGAASLAAFCCFGRRSLALSCRLPLYHSPVGGGSLGRAPLGASVAALATGVLLATAAGFRAGSGGRACTGVACRSSFFAIPNLAPPMLVCTARRGWRRSADSRACRPGYSPSGFRTWFAALARRPLLASQYAAAAALRLHSRLSLRFDRPSPACPHAPGAGSHFPCYAWLLARLPWYPRRSVASALLQCLNALLRACRLSGWLLLPTFPGPPAGFPVKMALITARALPKGRAAWAYLSLSRLCCPPPANCWPSRCATRRSRAGACV